jgi:hypothetical protein
VITKHTPGPWSVDGDYVGAGDFNIALMTKAGIEQAEEWAANQRLLAAAPMLLKSLIDATLLLEGIADFKNLSESGMILTTAKEARVAITAATGEEQL